MLTLEELKTLKVGDWVWVIYHKQDDDEEFYSQINSCMSGNYVRNPADTNSVFLFMEDYGTKWVAYKSKEEAEGKLVVPPCRIDDILYLLDTYSNDVKEWFVKEGRCSMLQQKADKSWKVRINYGYQSCYDEKGSNFGVKIFTNKDEAETKLKELKGENK